MPLDPSLRDRISAEVDRLSDSLLADIQSVVRVPSIVGQEAAVQTRMEQLYRDAGLDLSVEVVTPDMEALRSHPGFVDTQMSYDGRRNVVAKQKGAGEGRSLILNGHIDVVALGALEDWTRDPWGAQIEGDWMYGRGAGDMKAGVVANLYALKAIRNIGLAPAGDIMLQSVIDEEAGGAGGTLACLAQGYRADAMICTEPQSLDITIAHVGVSYFRIRVKGMQAHAAFAHRGVNALTKAAKVITALAALDEERGRTVHNALLDGGEGRSCHLNVGVCHAGDWPSSVPAEAVIECRMGFVPGETLSEMRKLVESVIADVAKADEWLKLHPPEIEWYGWQTDPWNQDPEHPFVLTLKDVAESVRQVPVRLTGATGGIDSRFSRYWGMAAACTGPIAEKIHGANERVNIPSIITTTKIVANAAIAWCGSKS